MKNVEHFTLRCTHSSNSGGKMNAVGCILLCKNSSEVGTQLMQSFNFDMSKLHSIHRDLQIRAFPLNSNPNNLVP